MGPIVRAGLVLLLAVLLVTGCGGDGAEVTSADAPPQEPGLVALVVGSNVGGRVSSTAVPVGSAAAFADFVAQFEGAFGEQVASRARSVDAPEGQTLLAAVVGLSCDPPDDVEVEVAGDRVTVTPVGSKPGGRQCLVPVTTVALVTAVV